MLFAESVGGNLEGCKNLVDIKNLFWESENVETLRQIDGNAEIILSMAENVNGNEWD